MKIAVVILFLLLNTLNYRVLQLKVELKQLQTNAAIALLSAEAANNKVGAIAPYFTQDKEAFTKAWLDSVNMPLAVFPDDILTPLKRSLEDRRTNKVSLQLRSTVFK